MTFSTVSERLALAVTGAVLVAFAAPNIEQAEALTVFTDRTAFTSNLQPGSYLESFDSLPLQLVPSPLSFSQNGFSYTATAANGFFPAGSRADVWLSTNTALNSIGFNFTSGNVSAIGGAFFASDILGSRVPGNVTVTLSDGTTQTLTNNDSSSFIGFIANPGSIFTSLMIAAVQPVEGSRIWSTVDDLQVGTASTPVPTPALLPGLVGMGIAAYRKRKGELAQENSDA